MNDATDAHAEAGARIVTKSWWRRYWIAVVVIGVAALCGLCAAIFFIVPPSIAVTPGLEVVAQQALLKPASAKLHVQTNEDWNAPAQGDYAVEDGMVLFPQGRSVNSLFNLQLVNRDIRVPVLVYAADGRDMTIRSGPPTDRSWAYYSEWYLYNCRAVALHRLWWACTLLVGGNI